jgi:uncharacterized coiled-coil DUF342 family protein
MHADDTYILKMSVNLSLLCYTELVKKLVIAERTVAEEATARKKEIIATNSNTDEWNGLVHKYDELVDKYDAKCRQLNEITKERNDFEMKLNGISKRLSGAITARHVIGKKLRELEEKYDTVKLKPVVLSEVD